MSSALAILPKSRITDLPNVSQIKIRIQEYCLAKPPPANKVRFGRLLLVLPAINKFRWNFRIQREKKQKRSDQVLLFGIQLSIINQPAEPGELVLQANPWQHRCRPSYSRPLSGEIIWSTLATLEKPSKLNLINWFFSILESLSPWCMVSPSLSRNYWKSITLQAWQKFDKIGYTFWKCHKITPIS